MGKSTKETSCQLHALSGRPSRGCCAPGGGGGSSEHVPSQSLPAPWGHHGLPAWSLQRRPNLLYARRGASFRGWTRPHTAKHSGGLPDSTTLNFPVLQSRGSSTGPMPTAVPCQVPSDSCLLFVALQQPHETGAVLSPTSQMPKLRPREMKSPLEEFCSWQVQASRYKLTLANP